MKDYNVIEENISLFMTKEEFSTKIIQMKESNPDVSFVDIIDEYCIDIGLDIDKVPKLLTEKLLTEIEIESEKLRLITKEPKLIFV